MKYLVEHILSLGLSFNLSTLELLAQIDFTITTSPRWVTFLKFAGFAWTQASAANTELKSKAGHATHEIQLSQKMGMRGMPAEKTKLVPRLSQRRIIRAHATLHLWSFSTWEPQGPKFLQVNPTKVLPPSRILLVAGRESHAYSSWSFPSSLILCRTRMFLSPCKQPLNPHEFKISQLNWVMVRWTAVKSVSVSLSSSS